MKRINRRKKLQITCAILAAFGFFLMLCAEGAGQHDLPATEVAKRGIIGIGVMIAGMLGACWLEV